MQIINEQHPTEEEFIKFFSEAEDGPFIMVNLLKFKEKAQYADSSNTDISGQEAYFRYGACVGEFIAKVGGKPIYSGIVTGLMLGKIEENWDMIALVEYPSLASFKDMLLMPEYQKISIHRDAGLSGQLNIKSKSLTR